MMEGLLAAGRVLLYGVERLDLDAERLEGDLRTQLGGEDSRA